LTRNNVDDTVRKAATSTTRTRTGTIYTGRTITATSKHGRADLKHILRNGE
jgi:hypothetical protein